MRSYRSDGGAVRTSETSVYFCETILRYIPEYCHIRTRCRDNMKSHEMGLFVDFKMLLAVSEDFLNRSRLFCYETRVLNPFLNSLQWNRILLK
jgi:hypothetical protein